MVLQKENAIAENRKIMGATNPEEADPGTIEKNLEFLLTKILFTVLIVKKMQTKK